MAPRFGVPPGFHGARQEPTVGEFQPGAEVGVTDPDATRKGSRGVRVRVRAMSSGRNVAVTAHNTSKIEVFG